MRRGVEGGIEDNWDKRGKGGKGDKGGERGEGGKVDEGGRGDVILSVSVFVFVFIIFRVIADVIFFPMMHYVLGLGPT